MRDCSERKAQRNLPAVRTGAPRPIASLRCSGMKNRKGASMSAVSPFRIAVPDAVLADLKSRLRNTRWPEAELVDDWSQGAPLKWIRDVCGYWAEQYDWRKREAALNRFAQFTIDIDGLGIHFIHARSPHPQAMPLII